MHFQLKEPLRRIQFRSQDSSINKPKQQQRSKNVVLRLKQDFHESGEFLDAKPFQKGGLLAGNLKQGTVTVQNRMIPRRPIIRVSPIQRRISNLFNDTLRSIRSELQDKILKKTLNFFFFFF